jgi:hypothetical protein
VPDAQDIVFPEVDLSGDDGDPGWEGGWSQPIPGRPAHHRYVRQPGMYARIWESIQAEWREAVIAYETDPQDFYASWVYLNGHPMFWYFMTGGARVRPSRHVSRLVHSTGIREGTDIDPHRIDEQGSSHDNDARNTHTEIWYETGHITLLPPEEGELRPHPTHYHDYELDGSAPTYEEAIIQLAGKVHDRYGNDRRVCDAPYDPDRADSVDQRS